MCKPPAGARIAIAAHASLSTNLRLVLVVNDWQNCEAHVFMVLLWLEHYPTSARMQLHSFALWRIIPLRH